MSIAAINNPAQAYAGASPPLEERVKQKTLGQEDFFKLLTTQLASQDPMAPMEDTAFIAQMASFSELEMTSSLTKSFDSFTSSQQFAAAHGFIGKTVTLSSGEAGEVTSVERQDGETLVFLNGKNTDGRDINTIYKVEPTKTSSGGAGTAGTASASSSGSATAAATSDENFVGPLNAEESPQSGTRAAPLK